MKTTQYDIEKLAENEWLKHSLYTMSERAIPSFVDGMKPSARFYTYASLKMTKDSFDKIDAVAGALSKFGYAHGSVSGGGAAQLMAADWYTTVPIIEGRGGFGSRLIQVPSATRYVYTKIHKNFWKYFKDIDLAPAHPDPEIEIPQFYIPVIPYVLLNNTSGLATGFSTNIFARNVDDVKKACIEYIKTKKIKTKIRYDFPKFNGRCEDGDDGKVVMYGSFERKDKTTIRITEVPYMNMKQRYDRENYVSILDKLEEDEKIAGYDDLCDGSGFKFDVKFKRGSKELSDDEVYDLLKLKVNLTENITVINDKGMPKVYEDAQSLIVDFCEFRKPFMQKRIDKNLAELGEENRFKRVKMHFIISVLENKIVFKEKKRKEVEDQIMSVVKGVKEEDVDSLLRINILSLTSEQVSALADDILKNKKEIEYWTNTTVEEQFLNDLNEI